MAAPEIAKTVRQMFETGKVIGRHDVKKSPGGTDVAAESGVFENEPTTVVEGVVKGGDFPASDVDQVTPANARFPSSRKISVPHRKHFPFDENVAKIVGGARACGSQRRVAGVPQAIGTVLYFSASP